MKRLATIFLIALLFLPVTGWSAGIVLLGGGGYSCTASITHDAAISGDQSIFRDTDRTYAGFVFTPAANITICKLAVKLSLDAGSITGQNYRANVYTMTGTSLNAAITNSRSIGVAGVDTWSQTVVEFSWPIDACPALTSGTEYGIFWDHDGSINDTNVALLNYTDSSGLPGERRRWKADKTQESEATDDGDDIWVVIYGRQ